MKTKTKMNQAFALAIVALPLCFSISGCEVKPAVAVRSEVQPTVAPDHFEAATLNTHKVTMFMWREETTPDQVAEVLSSSNEIDVKSLEKAHLDKKKANFTDRFKEFTIDPDELTKAKRDLADNEMELEGAQKEADETEVAFKADYPVDLKCKKNCSKDAKFQEFNKRNKERKSKKSKADRIKNITMPRKQEAIDEQMTKIRTAGMEQAIETWFSEGPALEGSIKQLQSEMADASKRIDERVWMFNAKPSKITLTLKEDGSYSGEILNWDLSNIGDEAVKTQELPQAQNFSTENGNIGLITYNPRGAIFTFEVTTSGAVYGFRLWRSKYELGKNDGASYYQGEITRTSVEADGSTKIRRGSIKLEVTDEGAQK
ncbi:hypothetical protein WDW86_04195 [Bdellovibrionota bacterium FG-2]